MGGGLGYLAGVRIACPISLLAVLALAGCDDRSDEWTGWAYPNADNLRFSVSLSGFRSFEECQAATIRELRLFDKPDSGSYVCGNRCRWNANARANVCAETRK